MLRTIWKDLLHHRGQTFFNIWGLAVVIFSYLILVALAETMDELLQESNLNRNLVIVQAGAAVVDESNISPEVVSAVQSLMPRTVNRMAPVIFRNIRISDSLVQLRATPVTDWESVFNLELAEGRWPSAPNEVAIGEGAKIANDWEIGTSLNIYGRDFKVAGVFRSAGLVIASVWMPLETAQELFAPRRASQLLVLQLTPGSDAETVRIKLEQDPSLKGQYAIFYEDTIAKRNTRVLYDVAMLVRIVATIALVSIIFGTYNLTSLSLEERRRDAGILRVLGFSSRAIRIFLSVRALLLGLLAYMIALVVAWIYMTLERNFSPIYILGLPFLFRLSAANIITALAWMFTLPPLGAWVATRRMLQGRVVLSLQRN